MVTILSWNIKNKNSSLFSLALKDIIKYQSIDIIIFQEAFGVHVNTILNAEFDEVTIVGSAGKKYVRIFIKKNHFDRFDLHTLPNNKLIFIRLKLKNGKDYFNIAGVHFYSKVANTERQQMWKSKPIIDKIVEIENVIQQFNTILVGDLNHNPYENNLCDPYLLNAKNSREIISFLLKTPLTKVDKDFWYNPMWNFLGDHDFVTNTPKITGSYFRYTNSEQPMWNLLDGFLVRPSVMDKINFNQSEILTKTNSINFLKPFIVRDDESFIKDDISDHLPIKFTLNFN